MKGEKKCVYLDVCEVITKYNDEGNEVEFAEFDSFGISFITKVKYNEKNQKIEQNRYTPIEGKRVAQFKSKYDEKGNCIEVRSELGYVEKYQFDEENRLSKKNIQYGNYRKPTETKYFYNDNDQIIIELNNFGKIEYTHDYNGNVIDEIYYNLNNKIETKGRYTYKYDEHKNWIAQIAYQDGTPVSYVERKIEYKD